MLENVSYCIMVPLFSTFLEAKMQGSKPEIVEEFVDTNVADGGDLCLVAKISGSPEPDVKWLKDKKNIAQDYRTTFEKRKDGEFRLLIKNVKTEDSGEYCMSAENSIGEVSCKADVKIAPPKR